MEKINDLVSETMLKYNVFVRELDGEQFVFLYENIKNKNRLELYSVETIFLFKYRSKDNKIAYGYYRYYLDLTLTLIPNMKTTKEIEDHIYSKVYFTSTYEEEFGDLKTIISKLKGNIPSIESTIQMYDKNMVIF